MKLFALLTAAALILASPASAQVKNVTKTISTNGLVENLVVPSGKTLTINSGGSIINNGTATGFTATAAWGSITGTLSSQTDLQTALDAKLATATAASTYQPLDSQLTALAGLADASGVLTNNGSGSLSYTATSTGGNTLGLDAGKIAVYGTSGELTVASALRLTAGPSVMGIWFNSGGSVPGRLTSDTSGFGSRLWTLPNVSGTLITTGDTGTVTSTMLAGSIALSKLAQSSATTGQAIAWDGSAWAPTTVSSTRTGVYRTLWLPAAAGIPRTTSGTGIGSYETTTNRINYDTLEYDAATDEHAQWLVKMPDEWNGGTVKAKIAWTAASGSGAAYWEVRATALTDDDALDTALGTAATTNDSLITASDLHETAATGACTIANTPAAGKYVLIQLSRDADNASDTLAVDALVIGITVQYQESSTEPTAW